MIGEGAKEANIRGMNRADNQKRVEGITDTRKEPGFRVIMGKRLNNHY